MSRMILTTLAKYWYCSDILNSAETVLREFHVRFDNIMSDVQTDRWTSIFIFNKTVALFRRSLQEQPSLRSTAVFDGGEMRTQVSR